MKGCAEIAWLRREIEVPTVQAGGLTPVPGGAGAAVPADCGAAG